MRVIVIEDDSDAAAFVKRVLSEAGHAVDVCGDGESGLNQARTGDYDALVVDRMLPGMDGLKLLKSYRDGGGRGMGPDRQDGGGAQGEPRGSVGRRAFRPFRRARRAGAGDVIPSILGKESCPSGGASYYHAP